MADGFSAEEKARRWVCIGWDVGIAYTGFAFAAGTGTEQQTFTPEAPPHMTRTPLPETKDQSRELLSYSSLLSDQVIREHSIVCDS
jgi:hypothetical protein